MVIEKNAKKKFFRKTWLTEKLKYTENREFSKTFFPYSFLKLNYLQAHIKKINKSISDIRDVPKLYHFLIFRFHLYFQVAFGSQLSEYFCSLVKDLFIFFNFKNFKNLRPKLQFGTSQNKIFLNFIFILFKKLYLS